MSISTDRGVVKFLFAYPLLSLGMKDFGPSFDQVNKITPIDHVDLLNYPEYKVANLLQLLYKSQHPPSFSTFDMQLKVHMMYSTFYTFRNSRTHIIMG